MPHPEVADDDWTIAFGLEQVEHHVIARDQVAGVRPQRALDGIAELAERALVMGENCILGSIVHLWRRRRSLNSVMITFG